ncbi:MAG: hypothetical protein ACRCZ2_09760 [Fusobacteriaceae bacterium]
MEKKYEKTIFHQIIDCNNKLKKALDQNYYTGSDIKRVVQNLQALEDDFIYMNDAEELLFITAKENMKKFLDRK